MDTLLSDIDIAVINNCDCSGQCMHDTHSITAAEKGSAIGKLNLVKRMIALRLCQTILYIHGIVSDVIRFGQCLNEDIYKFSANKCVEDFNQPTMQYVFAIFKYANSYLRNILILLMFKLTKRSIKGNNSFEDSCCA